MLEQLSGDKIQALIDAYVIPWGISGAQALIVFIVGKWLAGKITMLIGKALTRSKMDEMLVDFVKSIISWSLLLVVIIAHHIYC